MIRSQLRGIVVIITLLGGPVLVVGPTALGVWLLVAVGLNWITIFILMAGLSLSGLLTYHLGQVFHWVEFDGHCIRGRRFWTRELMEHSIEEVVAIQPLGPLHTSLETLLMEQLLGSVWGYEIEFQDGSRIPLSYDMTHVDSLIQSIQHASGF